MFFPAAGSIYNSLKLTELNMKWQQRKQNPNLKKRDDEDPTIRRLREDAEHNRKSSALASIDAKLKAGGELTDEELEYLKTNNPQLYQEAVKIRAERQAYKRELENCRTKEDVERLKARKVQGFLAEAKAIMGNPNIGEAKKAALMDGVLRRLMGITAEHGKFVRSAGFAALPREEELERAKKEEKERAEQGGDGQAPAPPWTPDRGEDPEQELMKLLNRGTGAEPARPEKPEAADGAEAPEPPDAPGQGGKPAPAAYDAKGRARPAQAPRPPRLSVKT